MPNWTQTTTPDGNNVRLIASFSDSGTSIGIMQGDIRLDTSSKAKADVDAVEEALKQFDDILQSLKEFDVHTDNDNDVDNDYDSLGV